MTAAAEPRRLLLTAPEAAAEGGVHAEPPTQVCQWVDLYRSLGWRVFPLCRATGKGTCAQHGKCDQPGKKPLIRWSQYRDGEITEQQMTAEWEKYPAANIGLVTGALIVLDVDGEDGFEALAGKLDPAMPDTPALTTGRIGGRHYIYAASGEKFSNFAGKLPHVDLRARGGYSILPPSVHHSGTTYKWVEDPRFTDPAPVPSWLRELAERRTAPEAHSVDSEGFTPELAQGTVLGQKARDFIANGAPSGGQRQAAVAAARNALSAGIPPGEVIRLVMQGFDRSPQDERRPWEYPHAVQIVNSLLSSPAPPPPPLEHRPSPGWDWGTPGANPQGSSEGSDDEPEDDSLGAFLDHRQTADFSPLIEGILDAGKSHWIWGDAGSGKTFLTLDWVFHLAQGKPYHGRKVRRTKSLLVEVDDIAQLPEYVETVAAAGQHDMEAIKANVRIVTKPIYHLKDRQGLQAILARVDAIEGLGLVVLDHFTKMTDPEVAWDARPKFVAELKDALSARGIALLVLDHGKVPPQNGEARDALNTLRGGSPKANIFHTGISITGKLKDGPIRLEWAKLRTGRRDNLLCSFNEDDGFTLEVEVDHNKLWDDLGKTDRAILDALTRRGPLGYDELTRETGKSLATLRRSVNNVLVPRGIIGHLSEGGNGRGDKARYGLVGGASPPRKKVVGWDF